jgi:hypothetical protein
MTSFRLSSIKSPTKRKIKILKYLKILSIKSKITKKTWLKFMYSIKAYRKQKSAVGGRIIRTPNE